MRNFTLEMYTLWIPKYDYIEPFSLLKVYLKYFKQIVGSVKLLGITIFVVYCHYHRRLCDICGLRNYFILCTHHDTIRKNDQMRFSIVFLHRFCSIQYNIYTVYASVPMFYVSMCTTVLFSQNFPRMV